MIYCKFYIKFSLLVLEFFDLLDKNVPIQYLVTEQNSQNWVVSFHQNDQNLINIALVRAFEELGRTVNLSSHESDVKFDEFDQFTGLKIEETERKSLKLWEKTWGHQDTEVLIAIQNLQGLQ